VLPYKQLRLAARQNMTDGAWHSKSTLA
jgi:hypothetical protein